MKKFISGILGRKEEAKESNSEVPDELPPLAEDIVAKASESQKEAKTEFPASKATEQEEVPDELPPLEDPPKSEEILETGTVDDLDKERVDDSDKESIPEAIKKAKLAKLKPDEIPMPRDVYTTKERIKAGIELGLFSNILEHIKKHDGAKERLLAGDLFARMDNYWEIRKHEIKAGIQLPAEKKLEEDLVNKLEELKALEQKWQVQKLALEEDLKFIHEREREIQIKIKDLNMISNELSLFRNVKPEEYFYMHNGVVLKNLHDLIDILEVIDEATLSCHVKDNKNDFGEWIRHVFKDNALADKIKNAKTKIEMIEILETIPVIGESEKPSTVVLSPKKYFWLANGTVIRNIYELSDALRVMSDELFSKHVNENKNDIAKWVNDVLKNEHLSQKLNKAKTRKEMIEILEAFL